MLFSHALDIRHLSSRGECSVTIDPVVSRFEFVSTVAKVSVDWRSCYACHPSAHLVSSIYRIRDIGFDLRLSTAGSKEFKIGHLRAGKPRFIGIPIGLK